MTIETTTVHATRRLSSVIAAAMLVVTALLWAPPPIQAASPAPGGPVILDGNDPADHTASVTQYIRDVYTSLDSNLASGYSHNSTVAVIGTCKAMLDSMTTGETFEQFDTALEVEALFSGIATNNYKHFHVCSDDDSTLPQAVEDELDKWGSALAFHVNRGGGLFATGHSFNWLGDLFPTVTVTSGGTGSSYVTADGATFFPNMTENQLVSAINHYTFGNLTGTPLLPLLTELTDGGGKLVAIGGANVRFPQISFDGPANSEVGTTETFTLTAADADGNALVATDFSWEITGVTTAAGSGTATTDTNGEYQFTFAGHSVGTTRIAVTMTLSGGGSAGSAITTSWINVPGAPTITSAVDAAGDGVVQVSWNAPADDGGKPIVDYVIEYSTNGSDWIPFVDGTSTSTSTEVTGLIDAITYQFRVAAINGAGQGAWSDPATGTGVGSPTAPDLHTAGGGNTVAELDWDAPTGDGGDTITGYVVHYRPAGPYGWSDQSIGSAAQTSTTLTGLTNGQEYEVRVAAINGQGAGAWSVIRTVTPFTVPGPVVDLGVTAGPGSLVFAWAEPVADGGSPVTGYTVTTDFASGCTPEHWHPEGDHVAHWWRCTVTGLVGGTEYTFGVAAVNPAGAGAATELAGTPEQGASVGRFGGKHRYETAALLSGGEFTDPAAVDVVFIATGLNFPDAAAGAAAAGKLGAPLLLTSPEGLTQEIRSELTRLDPSTIVILGGVAVVPESVAEELATYAPTVRLAGPSRYETAVEISRQAFPTDGSAAVVILASGESFADALSAAPAATKLGGPVLLTRPDELPGSVRAEIARLSPDRIIVLGGPGAISDAVVADLAGLAPDVDRISGATRFDTGTALSAEAFAGGSSKAFVATGWQFADALVGAATAAGQGAPLLLVTPGSLPQGVASEITRLGAITIVILGGDSAVDAAVQQALEALLGL